MLVGLSGGKDSLATLDLVVTAFGHTNVVAFFMYFVKGLRCVESHVDTAARRHKVELVKVPHFALGDLYKNAVLMPPRRLAHGWRRMKYGDIEQYVRKQTGIEWVAMGHRMTDSPQRRGMLHHFSGCNTKQHRLYPLWEWSPKDVLGYLRARKIPTPPQIGTTNVSGIDLRPGTLRQIRDNYPDDWRRFLETFPYAEAAIMHDEMKGTDGQAAPTAHG